MADYTVKPHTYPRKFTEPVEEMNARSLERWTREHLIDEGWRDLSLQNSWVNFGGGYAQARYRKTAHGYVAVRGFVKNGTTTASTLLATLPYGYRPSETLVFLAVHNTKSYCDFTVNTAGQILVGTGWSATWTAFDILFPVD